MPVIKSIGRRIWNTLTFRPAERQKPLPQTAYNPIIGQLHRVEAQKVELPFAEEQLYQQVLAQFIENTPYYENVRQIVEGNQGYVILGGPHGTNLATTEGVHSPIGWDRAFSVVLGELTSLCVKGGGFSRSRGSSYQAITYGLKDEGVHLPFDMNLYTNYVEHRILGSGPRDDFLADAKGAYKLIKKLIRIDGEIGGLTIPLSVKELKSFPDPANSSQTKEGWDYFTNIGVMKDKLKLVRVAMAVRDHPSSTRRLRWAANRFIRRVSGGKKLPKWLRKTVGNAFMDIVKPSVYTYKGDELRIGNLFRQLLSNGFNFMDTSLVEFGLINRAQHETAAAKGHSPVNYLDNQTIKDKYIDRILSSAYSYSGLEIRLPVSTEHDLKTENGRRLYLRQVRALNNEVIEQFTREMAREYGRQAGVLHGCGGNFGGHKSGHPMGEITLFLENPKDNSKLFLSMRLFGKRKCEVKLLDIDGQELDYVDLSEYKIFGASGKKKGKYFRYGVPGGGSLRADNCGFNGPKDLHSVSDDFTEMHALSLHYPHEVNNLPIVDQLAHFHAKMIQKMDLELLFSARIGDLSREGKVRGEGTFQELNDIFGGEKNDFTRLQEVFMRSYRKYYQLSRKQLASKEFKVKDQEAPIYIFAGYLGASQQVERLQHYIHGDPQPRSASHELETAGKITTKLS